MGLNPVPSQLWCVEQVPKYWKYLKRTKLNFHLSHIFFIFHCFSLSFWNGNTLFFQPTAPHLLTFSPVLLLQRAVIFPYHGHVPRRPHQCSLWRPQPEHHSLLQTPSGPHCLLGPPSGLRQHTSPHSGQELELKDTYSWKTQPVLVLFLLLLMPLSQWNVSTRVCG